MEVERSALGEGAVWALKHTLKTLHQTAIEIKKTAFAFKLFFQKCGHYIFFITGLNEMTIQAMNKISPRHAII